MLSDKLLKIISITSYRPFKRGSSNSIIVPMIYPNIIKMLRYSTVNDFLLYMYITEKAHIIVSTGCIMINSKTFISP